ncbi:MAG: ABC transporter permease [Muribaculaceae bacterium]|nr:ABC transporter permease [Muribaculaceae bacterium]
MNILPFIKKECLHVLRDKRMMLVVIMIPVVQMLLFGFAISTEVNDVRVAVACEYYNENIRKSVERLDANSYITVVGMVDESQIADAMRRGEADAVVVFKRNGAPQVIADASNPNMAQTAVIYIQSILSEGIASDAVVQHLLYNPQLKSAYNFAPAIMGMVFLLVCALMTAVSIVREKENGTMEVLLVSPVRPIKIIISKMVPFFILSCLDLTLILLIARFLLDVPLSSGIVPVVGVSMLYIALALALGLLVSTIARTQVVAMLVAGMVMIMPVLMLSGMLFPTDNLPVVLREMSCIVPARWYIDAMRKLMIMGLGFSDVLKEFFILLGMTLLLVVVALKKFKDRLC